MKGTSHTNFAPSGEAAFEHSMVLRVDTLPQRIGLKPGDGAPDAGVKREYRAEIGRQSANRGLVKDGAPPLVAVDEVSFLARRHAMSVKSFQEAKAAGMTVS